MRAALVLAGMTERVTGQASRHETDLEALVARRRHAAAERVQLAVTPALAASWEGAPPPAGGCIRAARPHDDL